MPRDASDDKQPSAGEPTRAPGTRGAAPSRRRFPITLVALAAGGGAGAIYGAAGAGLRLDAAHVMLILGGMTLGWCAVLLYRVLEPLFRPAGAGEGDRAPVRLRDLEREKQLVLKAIREVELDYQMRKVAEADYKELVGRYRARAMRLLREIDAGDDWKKLVEDELRARLAALEAAGTASASEGEPRR